MAALWCSTSPARTRRPRRASRPSSSARKAATQRPVVPPPEIVLPVPPTITPPTTGELELVELTRQELSKTDEAMARQAGPALAQGSGRGGDSAIVGQGPRGETLYAAEWLREPTDQEVGHYIPADAGAGLRGHRLQDLSPISGRRLRRARQRSGELAPRPRAPQGRVAIQGQAAAQERPADDRRMGANPLRLRSPGKAGNR